MLEESIILTKEGSYSFLHIAEHFLYDRHCYFINNLCNTHLAGHLNWVGWVLKNPFFDIAP